MSHSRQYVHWVNAWRPHGPEAEVVYRPCLAPRVHWVSYWRTFCQEMESTEKREYRPLVWRVGEVMSHDQLTRAAEEALNELAPSFSVRDMWGWLQEYMTMDICDTPDALNISEIPLWLDRLYNIGDMEVEDTSKVMIGSFCNYFSEVWSDPLSQNLDLPQEDVADILATDLTQSDKLDRHDVKPFLAKLHLVADKFSCTNMVLFPVRWAVTCTTIFAEKGYPHIQRSPRVQQFVVPNAVIEALRTGQIPHRDHWGS